MAAQVTDLGAGGSGALQPGEHKTSCQEKERNSRGKAAWESSRCPATAEPHSHENPQAFKGHRWPLSGHLLGTQLYQVSMGGILLGAK